MTKKPSSARFADQHTHPAVRPVDGKSVEIREIGVPGDLGWVLMAHAELYHRDYGWALEAEVARILADYADSARPGRDQAWIAEVDGHRAGSVFCMRVDERTAQLRLLLLEPPARGRGVGAALVETCVRFATTTGYDRLTLWTNEPLTSARHLYTRAGFRVINRQRHSDYGPELLALKYELELTPADDSATPP